VLQMSHVAWSACLFVCLCVGLTDVLWKKRLNQSLPLESDYSQRNLVLDGGRDSDPEEGAILEVVRPSVSEKH